MSMKLLKEIDFGEPDANVEYMASLKSNTEPMYIRAWSKPKLNNFDLFKNGQKFIITGQKGTGKTAILRHLEMEAIRGGFDTEFVVFKNEIIREAELLNLDKSIVTGAVLDEEKIRESKFYYHSIKRVMIALLISKLTRSESGQNINPSISRFVDSLVGKRGQDALRLAFDSIVNVLSSSQIDVEKASSGYVKVDPGQVIKKNNDDLISFFIEKARRQGSKIKIYFDEMHFAFRDKASFRSDSALVRDTILAAQILNERFTKESLDIVIYIALRREFLDQPEIAQADIVHVVESYSEAISWEHFPANPKHPIFDFITLRFKAALGERFSKTDLQDMYLKELDLTEIVNYTWSKPRDIVRFFKAAQSVDANTIVIRRTKYRIIIREYSKLAWREIRSSLAAFLPVETLPLLERTLKALITGQFDGSTNVSHDQFRNRIAPVHAACVRQGVNYDLDELCNILYMMGVYYYRYIDRNGREIYQQYHRGNTNPEQDGDVLIHPAIAKALS